MTSPIYQNYLNLLEKLGEPQKYWPQWCLEPQEKDEYLRLLISLGAILVQRTSWQNTHLALIKLKENDLLSLDKLALLPQEIKLSPYIKSAGFHQSKPERIRLLTQFVRQRYGSFSNMKKEKTMKLRKELLAIKGIGPETADVILLYSLDKPIFVIDEYTRRLSQDLKFDRNLSYQKLQNLFTQELPSDLKVFQNYHALIIISQKGAEKAKMKLV